MVSTASRMMNHLYSGITGLLHNGCGPAFAPRMSYNSGMVVVGTTGTMFSNGGRASGICAHCANCPNNRHFGAPTRLHGHPSKVSGVLHRTIGNVLPGNPLNHSLVSGLFVCSNARRGRRTRRPGTVSVGRCGWLE